MPTTRQLLATGAAALLGLTTVAPAVAQQQADVATARIAGDTRFDTAVAIADQQYDAATGVVIARSDAFPDAMAAAPLARAANAPVLLTRTDELPASTRDAIERLGATQATVLGGSTAVSDDVVATLEDELGMDVTRVAGDTRYDTAAVVARAVQSASDNGANFPGDQRAAFIALGEDFPDALATGPLAASRDNAIPILLTRTDALADETVAAIEDLDIELAIIAGGPTAVSEDVEQELEDLGLAVDRVAGDTRQATATALADFGVEYLDLDVSQVELTRGDLFVDALAAGPYAGANAHPILLTQGPDELSDATGTWLADTCPEIATIEAVGGELALTPETLDEAERIAETCTAEDAEQDLEIAPMERIERVPGESQEFDLLRVDDEEPADDFTTDIALFPCESLDEPQDGTWVFDDTNDDDLADGISSSDTGAATISELNGTDVEDDTYFRDVAVGEDGNVSATLTAGGEDCTDVVFFVDVNDNSALDLDADDQPVEPWGFSEMAWVSPNA